ETSLCFIGTRGGGRGRRRRAMGWVTAPAALVLIALVLVDAFEAMVLPRRVAHAYRLARLFYQGGWAAWRTAAGLLRPGRRRQPFLSVFGPLSLLALLALWAAGLVSGFALLHWALETPFITLASGAAVPGSLTTCLYFSGVTFFTLGYG